jgi:uncharacterized protein YoxC
MKRKYKIITVTALLFASLYLYLTHETAEEKVNRYLDEIEVVLSKKSGDKAGIIAEASHGLDAAKYCTEDVTMELLPGQKIQGKNQLAGYIGNARGNVNSATVKLSYREISKKDDVISVILNGRVEVLLADDDKYVKNYRYEMKWIEVDDDWLISDCNIAKKASDSLFPETHY